MQAMNWKNAATRLAEKFPRAFPREVSSALAADRAPALAVAFSGGADSLCALLLVWAKFPKARERLAALHFDHAVRKTSAADAAFAREVCGALGVRFFSERRECDDGNAHGEAELREARLDFFARKMRECGAKILVQGHQRDDVAETLLMRVARGAGTDGLAAPRPVSRRPDGRIFARPLLDFSKGEIVAALRECGIPWREDETNAGTDYFRNRVRNRALPELRAAAPFENFARSRRLAEEDADALDALAEFFLKKSAPADADFRFSDFATTPAVARRILRKIFARERLPLRAGTADALVEALRAGTPLKTEIAGTRIALDAAGTLSLKKRAGTPDAGRGNAAGKFLGSWTSESVDVSPELFAKIRAGEFSPKETVFLAGTPEISVRAWRVGERYRPLGASGEKTLGDAFTDRKIPRGLRERLPVFADAQGAAWVPGLPPAERFRIREAGGKALRLTYRAESLPL